MNKKSKKEVRAKVTDKFRKKLFESLFEEYSCRFLEKELGFSHSTLYHYKNKVIKTIPMVLLERCRKLIGFSEAKLEDNIINKVSLKEVQNKGLEIGRSCRKDQLKKWRNEIQKWMK